MKIEHGQKILVLGALCQVKHVNGPNLTVDLLQRLGKWNGSVVGGVFAIGDGHYFVKSAQSKRLYLVRVDVTRDDGGKIVDVKIHGLEGVDNG